MHASALCTSFKMAEGSQAKDVSQNPEFGKDDDTKVLNLNIKTTKKKEAVQVAVDCTVKQLKELLSERMEAPVSQQCLIFAGKILKDDEPLSGQGVKDGVTIHLVIRSTVNKPASASGSSSQPPPTTTGTAAPTTTTSSSAPHSAARPGASPFGTLGAPQGDLQQQMAQMQQQLQSNPELMQQLMESPMMQNMLSNPEAIQSILTSNPQMQQLMERNPELSHILHNPELMRQALEMTRNPAAMRELMRSQDRQLSNIESLPGGFNALARMYTEIQEPMMDAAQESLQQQLQNNPFSALFGQQQAAPDPGESTPQGTTNTDPLPNPWAPPTSSTPRTATTSSTSSTTRPTPTQNTTGVGAGGMAAMMQQMQSNPELMQQMMGGAGGNPMAIAQNPELMAQLMQSPLFQQSMESMMNNPELMEQAMRNNPMLAGNPRAAEMARQATQMMQNSEMRQLLTNPEAMRAMMQIQQGMATLQQTAPGLLRPGLAGFPGGATPTTSSGATPTQQQQMPGGGPPNPAALQQAMAQALGAGGQTPVSLENQQLAQAEVLYRSQLEQLANMGFPNRQANLRALVETGGDVNAAINRLIQ